MAKNLNPVQKRNRVNRGLYIVLAVLIAATMLITVIAFSAAKRSAAKTPPEESKNALTTDAADRQETRANEPAASTEKQTEPDVGSERVLPEDTEAVKQNEDTETAPPESGGDSPAVFEMVFVMPAAGAVAKEYSGDVPVFSATMNDYRLHTGVDVTADPGSAVVCAADGTVTNVYSDPLRGVTVTVEHGGGFVSLYRGLASELAPGIEAGRTLTAGEVIGAVGSTDLLEISELPHVHFELYRDGVTVDPLLYLASEEAFAYED